MEDAGSYQIMVTLNDNGPQPKFDTEISFTIEIEYTPMPLEDLQELLEMREFEQGSSAVSGEGT